MDRTTEGIEGYNLIEPLSRNNDSLNMSRLVVYAAENINYKIREDLMDDENATIWLEIKPEGGKKVIYGFHYREHQHLKQGPNSSSGSNEEQLQRWRKFCEQWKRASINNDCIVMGDLNIDYRQWNKLTGLHKNLGKIVDEELITLGFAQLISKSTRFWPNTTDSILDHVWTNCSTRIVGTENKVRGPSDHNVIDVKVRVKKMIKTESAIRKRVMTNFNADKLREELNKVDWKQMERMADVDTMEEFYTKSITEILDVMAPIKLIQMRKNYAAWLTQKTRDLMKKRDKAKVDTTQNGSDENWSEYKKLRNKCLKEQRKDKMNHERTIFHESEQEPTSKKNVENSEKQTRVDNRRPAREIASRPRHTHISKEDVKHHESILPGQGENHSRRNETHKQRSVGNLKESTGKMGK